MVHGAGCMVHGACRASEASRVMRHPLFQRGPRGLLVHNCGQAAETRAACPSRHWKWRRVLRVARRPGDKAAIRRKAANAPDCSSTAQSCRASSGAPRRQSVQLKRLFLSPSAFFEPAKKVRKNGKRQRPVAVSRDTGDMSPFHSCHRPLRSPLHDIAFAQKLSHPKKSCQRASEASRALMEKQVAYHNPKNKKPP